MWDQLSTHIQEALTNELLLTLLLAPSILQTIKTMSVSLTTKKLDTKRCQSGPLLKFSMIKLSMTNWNGMYETTYQQKYNNHEENPQVGKTGVVQYTKAAHRGPYHEEI